MAGLLGKFERLLRPRGRRGKCPPGGAERRGLYESLRGWTRTLLVALASITFVAEVLLFDLFGMGDVAVEDLGNLSVPPEAG